jgi:hypothetical protein
MFKKEFRNWIEYRSLPGIREVELHFGENMGGSFYENMDAIRVLALDSIKNAYHDNEIQYVMFTHGSSTSGSGRISSRSVIRGLMRHKDATPFICRKDCIQHDSVFVAAMRQKT